MSDNQPPHQPGQPQGGPYPPGGQPWEAIGEHYGPPPKKRRKGLIIGGIGAAAALLVAGGGVFAWTALSGGGSQPAEALPDSALAYARVDLDPSAAQKVDLVRLLRRVPEFSELTGIDSNKADLRKALFEEALADSSCDVDYEDDIEPWIGDRAAVAAVPDGDQPAPVFVLQNTDEGAAKKGIDKLSECGGGSEAGVAFVDDYAVIAQSQQLADDAAEDAAAAPLSEDETFASDMDTLGEQGVASFWADGDGFAELADATGNTSDAAALDEIDSVAAALRAGSDYIELAAVTHLQNPLEAEERSDVGQLPEATVFAASVAGGGEYVDDGWDAFTKAAGGMMYDFQSRLDTFELSTGLTLPDDLTTVLGGNITIAADGRGMESIAESGGQPDPSDLGLGVRMTTDKGDVADLLDRVNENLTTQGLPELASAETDDGMVVATNEEYAEDLASDGSLGESDTFTTVVPDVDDAVGVLYLDVDKATEIARKIASEAGGSTEEIDQLDPISAVGLSVSSGEDGRNTSSLRVSFD